MTGDHQDGGNRGRGRGRGRGNGRGGREGNGRYQNGRYRGRGGRGRGYYDSNIDGRGGRGRGRQNGRDGLTVDLSCLPGNINLNNLTFTDDQWYGFDAQQRDAINTLPSFRNQQCQVNRMGRDHYGHHSRLRDDSSTLDTHTYPPVRHIYELNVSRDGHPLPFVDNTHTRRIRAMQVSKPKDRLTPEYLSQIWNCGIETTKKSIEATTCSRYYRQSRNGMQRRYRPSRSMMQYRQLSMPAGEFYSNTMFAKVRSTRGFTCVQVYGNKFGYIKAYPMDGKDKQNVGDTLSLIIQDVGVMQKLHIDNAKEMVGRKNPFLQASTQRRHRPYHN